jgi:hypothetical protein
MAWFVRSYWPLMLLALHQVLSRRRHLRETGSLIDVGVLGATLTVAAYHLFVALPVMSFSQRFLYPTLPALFFLATRGLGGLASELKDTLETLDRRLRALALCGAMVPLLMFVVPKGQKFAMQTVREWAQRHYRFDMARYGTSKHAGQWVSVSEISRLPDTLVVATTEVGLPGALNPRQAVIDLAGLNERLFAHQRFSADKLFSVYAPDVIYMPHPDYADMRKGLRKHPAMRGYDLYEREELPKGAMPIALRRDSPHFEALDRIIEGRLSGKGRRKKRERLR